MKQVSFTTNAQSPIVPIIVAVVVFVVFAGFIFLFIKRSKGSMPNVPEYNPPVVDDTSIPFPEEDPNEFYKRTHWWEGETQTPRPNQDSNEAEQYPDMFEEGNKRLDDEQHHHDS
jgi:hypothetical protein